MPLQSLNHYTVRTPDLERTRAFYVDVLGLRDGPRPPFNFPGHWLYVGENAVVHLVGESADASGLCEYLGDRPEPEESGTGSFDHIAFTASDIADMRECLRKHSVHFIQRTVPELSLEQIFVKDPGGVTIEMNFPD